MEYSKSAIHRKFNSLPELAFENHLRTSFSGLIVFQLLFARLNLKGLLNGCFQHLRVSPVLATVWWSCCWAIIDCVIFTTFRMNRWLSWTAQ